MSPLLYRLSYGPAIVTIRPIQTYCTRRKIATGLGVGVGTLHTVTEGRLRNHPMVRLHTAKTCPVILD